MSEKSSKQKSRIRTIKVILLQLKHSLNIFFGSHSSTKQPTNPNFCEKYPRCLLNQFMLVKPRPNDRNTPTQHIATLLGATCCVRLATVLRHVGCCSLKFETGQIWANNTQHVPTYRTKVAKRTQHVAPNNVAICCVGMLRSFGRGLTLSAGVQTRQY